MSVSECVSECVSVAIHHIIHQRVCIYTKSVQTDMQACSRTSNSGFENN